MNRHGFLMAKSHIGIPPFQYTGDEVLQEVNHVK